MNESRCPQCILEGNNGICDKKNCSNYPIEIKNPNAVALGSIKTKKKARSSRINGKKGGRPKKTK